MKFLERPTRRPMDGDARTAADPPLPEPALAGGVQLGSFLCTGVPGVLAVTRETLGEGETGGCLEAAEETDLEDNFPRIFANEDERPGVVGLAETEDRAGMELTRFGTGIGSFLGVTFNLTGLLFWNMF